MNRRHQDSAGAAAPAESGGDSSSQPEHACGDAGPMESHTERRQLVDTLDVVPAVAAGAALGARRVK